MAERLAWPLLALLGIAFARTDVEIPEWVLSCSETSDEFCEATSLLQLSLVHAETDRFGQRKPARQQRESQALVSVIADAETFSAGLAVHHSSGPDWDNQWDPCDDEKVENLQKRMDSVRSQSPEQFCKAEYEEASRLIRMLKDTDQNNNSNCKNDALISATQNKAFAYLSCVMDTHSKELMFQFYMLSPLQTNVFTSLLIIFVIGSVSWDWSFGTSNKSCSGWVVVMLGFSFMCFMVGFFVNSAAWLMKARMSDGSMTTLSIGCKHTEGEACTASLFHVIVRVMSMGGGPRMIGVLFLIFVVGDPLFKLLLLVFGEVYRYSESTVGLARRCIVFARVIAKWASPLHLFTLIYHCQLLAIEKPEVLDTSTVLDLGWVCFTVFVLTYSIATLSISIPPLPLDQRNRPQFRISNRCKMFVLLCTLAISVVYSILLLLGCMKPLFSLSLKKYEAYSSQLDPKATAAMETTLSLFRCLWLMLERFLFSAQVIPFLAFAVLLGGVIIFAIADMSSMTLCAFHLQQGDNIAFSYWLNVSRVTRHCALVDVLLAGALLGYASSFLNLEDGVFVLLAAELLRYLTIYFIIEAVAVHIELPYPFIHRQHSWENRPNRFMAQALADKTLEEDERPTGEQPTGGSAEQHLMDSASGMPSKGVIRVERETKHTQPGPPSRFSDLARREVEAARGVQLHAA
mmetsp:Transcript_11133/g.20878  ORF Transcript_11133/g.20878 Transcript_11133/m.20878 type:complete len:688 (+) Transcript_11133:65-2128(+)